MSLNVALSHQCFRDFNLLSLLKYPEISANYIFIFVRVKFMRKTKRKKKIKVKLFLAKMLNVLAAVKMLVLV